MTSPGDISSLFSGTSSGPGLDVGYRAGRVLDFDPVTLTSRVLVGGAEVANVPLLGVAEADSYETGATVGVLTFVNDRGVVTYAIIGRFVTPGSADATAAITLLSSFIQSATVATQETIAVSSYSDLTTPGPTVDILVRSSGRVLVTVSASMEAYAPGGSTINSCEGYMSAALTGANVIAATDTRALSLFAGYDAPVTNNVGVKVRHGASRTALITGLTPGITTFTAKYKRFTNPVIFSDRNLTVQSL